MGECEINGTPHPWICTGLTVSRNTYFGVKYGLVTEGHCSPLGCPDESCTPIASATNCGSDGVTQTQCCELSISLLDRGLSNACGGACPCTPSSPAPSCGCARTCRGSVCPV